MDGGRVVTRGTGKRICFVSLSSYPLLAAKDMGFVGGAEVLLTQLGKEITKHEFEVSFITYGDGSKRIEYIDNIRVIKVYKRDEIFHLSLPIKVWYFWGALIKADADIYLESPGFPGIVSLFCRLWRRKSVLSVASDLEVMKKPITTNNKFYLTLGHRFNLKLVNTIIVQSEFQRSLLSENFGRESTLIKVPIPLSDTETPEKPSPPIVLWLATVRPVKQAELLLELARAIPEAKFQMIGGPALGDEPYFNSVQEAARHIPNLDFLGFIPYDRVGPYLEKASILVNTSLSEGFPFTFLQAWAAYTPVVSLNSDPDGVICRHRLGLHSKNFEQMSKDINLLLNNKELREEMGRNSRRYVEQEHDMQKIVTQYVALFRQLTGKV
jgi:glycosyltransferase involved in cell wall biosynthesis